jgi:two-component system, NarL family, sensor kinase
MSVGRKPMIRASGGIADFCSQPESQMACQGTRRERSEVSVLCAIIDAFSDPFAVADKFGRIVLKNVHWDLVSARSPLRADITDDDEAFMRTFGVVGSSLPDMASAATNFREMFTGERRSFSLPHKRADGRVVRWLQMSVTKIRGLPGHVAIIHRDISNLREAQSDIDRLSTAVFEVQENERRRIARVIHDTTAQELVASKLYLEKALDDVESSRSFYASGVKALDHLGHSLCEIRALSYLLHPPDLNEFSFSQAVRLFLKGFAERTGIQVAFDAMARLPPMSSDAEHVLFLIIQEALTNVYRHSGSRSASVVMRSMNGKLLLEIKDNGRGCQTCLIEGKLSTTPGVGIASMRARANGYRGTLTMQSNKHGTTLRVVFPTMYLARSAEIPLS